MSVHTHTKRAKWPLALAAALLAAMLPGVAHAIDWGPAIVDLSDSGQNSQAPQIAVSTDGTRATAVWLRSNGSNDIVQTRSASIAGGTATWGTVNNLSATGTDATDPQLAVSADGSRATAVWRRFNGSKYVIQSASATITGDTATWGVVTDVSVDTQNAGAPQVGLSSDGSRATAVWFRSDGTNFIVQSRSATIADTTATWGTVSDLSATGRDATAPQIELSADGSRATAIWRRSDGTNFIVQSRSATITGNTATWGDVTNLSAAGRNAEPDPQVRVSADGSRATAIWRRSDGTKLILQSRSATISGTSADWGGVTDLSASGQNAEYAPQMGLSSDGSRATAIWSRSNGTTEVMQSRSATVSGNTATWGTVAELSGVTNGAYEPQLGLSTDGSRATAVWRDVTSGNYFILSRSATIAGTSSSWGPTSTLSNASLNADYYPQLGVSADGLMATAVWFGNDGTWDIVQSQSGVATGQSITFPTPTDTRVDQGPVPLAATASSGLPVNYEAVTPTVCAVSGTTATLQAVGTCTLTAKQPGDPTYAPAADVTRSFTVTAAPGPSPSPSPSPTPVVPGKVTSVKAKAKGTKVTVTWAKPSTPITGYTVQFSTNKKKWKKAGTAGATATKFVWKKAKKGKTYYLRVRGSSQAGSGPWSKVVKVKVR